MAYSGTLPILHVSTFNPHLLPMSDVDWVLHQFSDVVKSNVNYIINIFNNEEFMFNVIRKKTKKGLFKDT